MLGGHVDGVQMTSRVEGIRAVCFSRSDPIDNSNATLSGSLLLIDRGVRDKIERDCVVTLAGPVCGELYSVEAGYRPEPPTTAAIERLTHKLQDDGYIERVARFEATPPLEIRTDEETIIYCAQLWCGDACAPSFIRWMLAETVALVRTPAFVRPLAALADTLMTHDELPGGEVRRIFEENTYPWERNGTSH